MPLLMQEHATLIAMMVAPSLIRKPDRFCAAIMQQLGKVKTMLKIEVLNAIPPFTLGQMLSSVADVAGYLRASVDEGKEDAEKTTLSDDDIVAIAASVPMDDKASDEWEGEVFEAIEAGVVPEKEGDEPSEISETMAGLLAKVNADKVFTDTVTGITAAQEKVDSGAAHLTFRLFALFPTVEERNVFPVPGSKGGNNPDIYITRKQKTNGEWGEVKGSNIRDWCNHQSTVIAAQQRIDAVKKEVPEGVKLGPEQNKRVKRYTAQKSSAVRALTRSIRVMHLLDTFTTHKHVGAAIDMEEVTVNGKSVETPTTSKYCIKVWNRHKTMDGNVLTVSTFISLKPMDEMGLATLLKSARKTRAPKGNVDKLVVDSKNLEPLFAKMVHALETPAVWASLTSALAPTDGEPGDNADHYAMTISRMETLCSSALSAPGMRKRVDKARAKLGQDAA